MKQIEGADFTIDNPIREEFIGKLLVIEPLEFEQDIKTTNGDADAVRCNAYVVKAADGSKYEAFEDTLIFARAMVRVLKGKIGKIVVGRLAQGEAKKGQSAPWLLAEPSEKDIAAATGLVMTLNATSSNKGGDDDFDDDFESEPAKGSAPEADDEGEF